MQHDYELNPQYQQYIPSVFSPLPHLINFLKHHLPKHQRLALKHQLSKTSTVKNINCQKHELAKT
jgi:hypothetical protein